MANQLQQFQGKWLLIDDHGQGRFISNEEAQAIRGGHVQPDIVGTVQGSSRKKKPQVVQGKAPMRSNLEVAFGQLLEGARQDGEVTRWSHESIKLRLSSQTYYTPDFFIETPDGRLGFYETKGFLRDDAAVKFKAACAQYPCFYFVMVKKTKGAWVVHMHTPNAFLLKSLAPVPS